MKPTIKSVALTTALRAHPERELFIRVLFPISLIIALLAGLPGHALAKDRSEVSAPFSQTGADDNARGKAHFRVGGDDSSLRLKLRGLDPSTHHSLKIGGMTVDDDLISNRQGRINRRLDDISPDPRGMELEIHDVDHDEDVLRISTFSGTGEPGNTVVLERNTLQATDIARANSPRAKGHSVFRERANGRMTFKVEVEHLTPGTVLELFVGSISRGTITVGNLGKGEIKFDTNADDSDELPLDFDPRGATIELRQGADTWFSGTTENQAACTPEIREAEIPRTADGTVLAPNGQATAQLKTQADCDRNFEVELEDVPVGVYELWVGGVKRGDITVVDIGAGRTKGEIEFEAEDDDADELPLDFDVLGQSIEIKQGATTLFQEPSFAPTAVSAACPFEETQMSLANVGPDADAKGTARLRTQEDCDKNFRVEVENLADGTYDLLMGGTDRGDITVAIGKGEIEFETNPEASELPLTFEVAGNLIEVKQGATVFLNGTIP